jgi:retron-type reverse transcriptase
MKRYNNLFEKIITIENLIVAEKNARKHKSKTKAVKNFDKNKEDNIIKLHNLLKSKKFKTSEYKIFTIHKPKERIIYSLPYYPDRIVHHAIMNILEPIWTSLFISTTYSSIKKRGIHKCLFDIQKALKNKNETIFCLKIDVEKFYPSINHDILKKIIRKKIKCKNTLELLDEIIDSVEGVPIGNYLSQYFGNLYLTYLDHYIKEDLELKYYFRYCDDMVFLHYDKSILQEKLKLINNYLTNKLNLKLKSNYQIFPIKNRSIDFIGYVIDHDKTKLRKRIKQNFIQKVKKLNKKGIRGDIYNKQLSSYLGWLKHGNCNNLKNKYIKNII